MIIASYLGAGGNRYYQMLQGVRDFAPATTYDHLLKTQNSAYRYPETNSTLEDMPVILTHCMNVPLLKSLWPTHQVHVILCDRLAGLRREWVLAGEAADITAEVEEAVNSALGQTTARVLSPQMASGLPTGVGALEQGSR